MKRIGFAALLLLGVAACNHRQPQPAAASANEEAAPSGIPQYPRAYPVALPVKVATTPPLASNAAPAVTNTYTPPPVAAASPPSDDTAASAPAETNMTASEAEANAAPPSTPASPAETPAATETPAPPVPAPESPTSPSTADGVPATLPVVPSQPPADPNQVVVLDTSFGRIVIKLDDFAAPKTCANFRKLVSTGFYDGTIFHRVIPQFMIQGGDPNTKGIDHALYGKGDPGYTLPPEIKLHHDQGAVAMARLPDSVNPQRYSNGSQFYICVVACPTLDDQYTVFGHVIAGLDVANRIANVPADRRSDPVERIAMRAMLESRDQAVRENTPTGP